MARRSIKDLERIAERVSAKVPNSTFKINQNASGYNVYRLINNQQGYNLAYAGTLNDCIVFLEGVDYSLVYLKG